MLFLFNSENIDTSSLQRNENGKIRFAKVPSNTKIAFFGKDFKTFKFNAPHTNSEIINYTFCKLDESRYRLYCTRISRTCSKMDMTENLLSKMDFEWNEDDIDKELETIWTQINLVKSNFNTS